MSGQSFQTGDHQEKGILNSMRADSSGKVIFESNELCCQFLNDYVDLPYFKDIQPENIEDVSSEFVPLFAQERHADRVKEIRIPNEKISFFIVSLIEHKTKVEYNIHMQIFRYMVYIWERYERQEEKKAPGCSNRKEFRYPPVIPIVYYEGKRKWTAARQFVSRITFGKQFKKYLPDFSYYVVPIHKYEDDILLKNGNGMSLVMLINNLQSVKDVEALRKLPVRKIEAIVKGLPEEQVDILTKVLKAFLVQENIPEEEAEELIEKVRMRKMGQLFENMDKMDIQAERRKTAKANAKAEKMQEKGIKEFVMVCKDLNATFDYVLEKLRISYNLTDEKAREKIRLYW